MWEWINMGMKGLGWMGGTGTELEGLGLVWNVWDGYIGSEVGEEGLGLVWRV